MTVIDRIDFELLSALQKNARISNKELAAKVGLAPSSTLARVRRLAREGVLLGSHAEVDPRALGIALEAMIFVQLAQHRRESVASFREHALSVPQVISLFHVAGSYDYLVHVVASDSDGLRELALTEFTTRPEVSRIETHLIFEHRHSRELPRLVEPDSWD